ncbi:Coproporphyrinogen dehydrogenase [Denitrovibrio acetiphilus DSM 12809]|uniref:Coproporphyrinogen dehydrogenase n=1 Tax=Denitrovibrio acetiphilus (strain DSM 12809 / NBRC 114555 / N2460) TaxID=522772 RepID=D4H5I3_DENA2|nr:heme anaerobic degradation radical SAM methyltransferase ChuW/HutW [Denitrovibrio acetiphilus]ADD67603.1 Coproporphyrinogen dehydrogenase [Denitrovibrio acetiphilus DSM 12809]
MNLNWHMEIDSETRQLIFGNENEDGLTRGYDRKRVVHAGGKGAPIRPEETQSVWKFETSSPSFVPKAVYINIPFCQTRCAYCGFFKNLAKDDMMESFTETLVKELKLSAELPLFGKGNVNAVYIGGGTPGALHNSQIERILDAINQYIPIANDCEFTFETRTFEFTKDKIETCLNAGVNRFSLGVQSFNSAARKVIGRVDDGDVVARKIEEMKKYNHAAVSIDLMYGLPYQSEKDFMEDILIADELGVDGMALYQLNVFDDSRLDKKVKSGSLPTVPSTKEQAIYHIKAYKMMQNLAYTQASMSHWTRGTRDRSLYNRMSKEGCVMHAYGAGAGGRTASCGYFTHPSLTPYINMVMNGIKPLMGMTRTTENSRLFNMIVSQTDCGHLRFDTLNRAAGTDMRSLLEPLVNSWQERGLVTVRENLMKLTPEGQFWYVNMAQAMIDVISLATDKEYIPQTARISAQN